MASSLLFVTRSRQCLMCLVPSGASQCPPERAGCRCCTSCMGCEHVTVMFFCTPALIKLTPVPAGTLNLPHVQRQLLWLLSMEVGADDVKSVLCPPSHRAFMLVLHKQNQNIWGRRMFRTKKTKPVLKFCLTLPTRFDSLLVTMFPQACPPLVAS